MLGVNIDLPRTSSKIKSTKLPESASVTTPYIPTFSEVFFPFLTKEARPFGANVANIRCRQSLQFAAKFTAFRVSSNSSILWEEEKGNE